MLKIPVSLWFPVQGGDVCVVVSVAKSSPSRQQLNGENLLHAEH